MVDILVRPAELRQIASQMRESAKKIGQALQNIDSDIQSLKSDKFLGNRANAVQSHYQAKRDALQKAKDLVLHFANDLETAANVFEQADNSITQSSSGNSALAGTSSSFEFPEWAKTRMKWIKDGGEVLQDLALVAVLKNGQTFADQVRIFGSNWYSQYVLGLSGNLRNIKATNLIDNLAAGSLKVTPWSTTFTMVKLAADVIPDWFKYTDVAHRGAAVAVDAFIAAGSLGASYYGMQGGALIGTAICPGVGTVIGGLAGGLLAGWATDHVLTTPFESLVPEITTVGGAVLGNSFVPGVGMVIGGASGNQAGKALVGLISPDVAQSSIKDFAIEGLSNFINNAGEAVGNLIYPSAPMQNSW